MLDSLQAKSSYKSLLIWLIIAIIWPLITGSLMILAAAVNFGNYGLIAGLSGFVYIGLIVWLLVRFWKLAPEVGTSKWASFWLLLPFFGLFIIGMLFLEPLKYASDNKPADRRLPSSWKMIKESLSFFSQNLNKFTKTSIWFIYIALIIAVSSAITMVYPLFGILHFLVMIAVIILSFWVSYKLFLEVSKLEGGKPLDGTEGQVAQNRLGSYVWTSFLLGLIVAGIPILAFIISLVILGFTGVGLQGMAGIFGSAVGSDISQTSSIAMIISSIIVLVTINGAIIWAIYKSNNYSFSIINVILKDQSGMQALRESERMGKSRWWGLIWKNYLWGLVLSVAVLALYIVIIVTSLIISAISNENTIISVIFLQAIQGGFQMLLVPASFVFQVKLFKAFDKTA